jgi:hypothetical protein
MTNSDVGYQRVREWVRAMLDSMHAAIVQTRPGQLCACYRRSGLFLEI